MNNDSGELRPTANHLYGGAPSAAAAAAAESSFSSPGGGMLGGGGGAISSTRTSTATAVNIERARDVLRNVAPITRTKAEAAASYTKMSGFWYDLMTGSSEKEFTEKGLAQLDVQPGESVLDIGFGTGFAIEQMVRATRAAEAKKKSLDSASDDDDDDPRGRVCGIDIAEGMVTKTKERLQKAGLSSPTNIELKAGDALSLPWPDESFDAVLLSFVLELFDADEIPQVLAEVLRVLRPGHGRFTVVSLARRIERTSVQLYEWLHKKMPSLVDCRPIFPREVVVALGNTVSLQAFEECSMWGLPVEVVTARKKEQNVGNASFASNPTSPRPGGANPTSPRASTTNIHVVAAAAGVSGGVVPRSMWMEDAEASACACCSKEFGFFRRRTHCRRCGRCVCSACSKSKLMISTEDESQASKICDLCSAQLRG